VKRIAAALAALGLIAAASLWLFVLVPSAHPRDADAILVLAGDRDRLDEGLALLHERVAPRLVISLDPAAWPRADGLCAHGAICFHAHPYSTQGEAETTARLIRRRGWHSIVVVTSRYHLRRAQILFDRCLPSKPAFVAAQTTFTDYVANIAWEWGKLLYQLTIDRGC